MILTKLLHKISKVKTEENIPLTKDEVEAVYTYYGIEIPEGLAWTKDFIYAKRFKVNGKNNKNLPLLLFYKTPLEVCRLEDKKVYRINAHYPEVMVNKEGKVRKIEDDSIPGEQMFNRYNFVQFSKSLVAHHRLVALAWCLNDDYYVKNLVDHIDANRTNNKAENLRWVSPSINIARAFNHGLDKRWLVKKIGNSRVMKFTSLEEIGNHFDMDKGSFSSKRCPFVIKTDDGGYIIEDATKLTNWSLEKDYDIMGDRYLYELHGIKYASLVPIYLKYVDKLNIPKHYLAYRKKFLKFMKDNGYEIKVIADIQIKKKKSICIEVKDITTGEVKQYDNKKEVQTTIGISKSRLNARLRGLQKTKVFKDKYLVYWCGEKVEPEQPGYKNKKVQATNKKTQQILTFGSIREAGRYFNVDKSIIRYYLNGERKNLFQKQWKFKYVNQ